MTMTGKCEGCGAEGFVGDQCEACGGRMLDEVDCVDCGRPVVWDEATGSWQHRDSGRGCFLIPEAAEAAEWAAHEAEMDERQRRHDAWADETFG